MIDSFEYSGGLEGTVPGEYGDIFFPLSGLLNEFAVMHLLYTRRHVRDSLSWYFHFLHPAGGSAGIQVCAIGKEEISVNGVWMLNAFEEKKTFVKYSETEKLTQPMENQESLMRRLDNMLRVVLGWPAGEWSCVIDRSEIWKAYSSQQELTEVLHDLDNLTVPRT